MSPDLKRCARNSRSRTITTRNNTHLERSTGGGRYDIRTYPLDLTYPREDPVDRVAGLKRIVPDVLPWVITLIHRDTRKIITDTSQMRNAIDFSANVCEWHLSKSPSRIGCVRHSDPTEQLFVTETVPTGSDNPASGRRLSRRVPLLPIWMPNLPRLARPLTGPRIKIVTY